MELNIPKLYAYMSTQFEILCNLLQDGSRREGKLRDPISSIRATISRLYLSIRSD